MSGRSGSNTPKGWPGRQPSLRGLLMVDTVRGVVRVRKWPEKRGRNRSAVNQWWSEWLRQAMLLWKYSDPRQQQLWRDATKDLPVKPTDPFIQAIRGTIWFFVDEDGIVLYPTQARDKVSYSLDIIEQLPGGMLVRGTHTWQGIEPANESGLILFSNSQKMPEWGTPTAAGIGRRPVGAYSSSTNLGTFSRNEWTPIPWTNVQQDDTDPPIWSSDHPERFTAPTDGWYSFSTFAKFGVSNDPIAHLAIHSSTSSVQVAENEFAVGGIHDSATAATVNIHLNANDYLYARVYYSGGNAVALPIVYAGFVRIG